MVHLWLLRGPAIRWEGLRASLPSLPKAASECLTV